MIDTDKYEGHTPAPWKAHNDFYKNGIDENNLGEVSSFRKTWGVTLSEEKLSDYRANRIGYHVMHIADAKLIADAPLLLAEVKELREQVRLAKEWVAKQYPCCLNTMDIFTEYIGDEEE
tara:strand:+ start:137 stop:493 length:357 start_codon:yes stop_codon:yes gene_type:complete